MLYNTQHYSTYEGGDYARCLHTKDSIDWDRQQDTAQHHHYRLLSRVANNTTQLTAKKILHTCNAVI